MKPINTLDPRQSAAKCLLLLFFQSVADWNADRWGHGARNVQQPANL